jgi:hypothetical protein
MSRSTLVFCLILTLLASGCADRQEVRPNPDRELADALTQQPGEQIHHGTWLEEHPGVTKTAFLSLLFLLMTVGIAAFGVAVAHGDPAAIHALLLTLIFQH